MCDHAYLPLNTEELCFGCGQWYYNDFHAGPQRILDREDTDADVTARRQTTIVLATRYLERHGQRYAIDFGWQNAEAIARSLGYRYSSDLA